MPYLELTEDDTRVYYELHGRPVEPATPVLLLLAPTSLSAAFMDYQYRDESLRSQFTMLSVDERNSGKSEGPYSSSYDAWVQSADLARLILQLGLPPVHVFSTQAGSTRTAIRLAVLFPDLVRTLVIGGIVIDMLHTPTPHNEFFDMWSKVAEATTPDQATDSLQRWVSYFFGDPSEKLAPPEVRERVLTFLRETHTLEHSDQLAHIARMIFFRTPVPRERVLNLHKPTLLLWGSENGSVPVMVAMGMSHRYKSADGKPAKMEVINGAPNLLSMSHPREVNAKLAAFIKAHHDARQRPADKKLTYDVPYWTEKLKDFDSMVEDPELGIAHRNPKSGLSFSALTPDRVQVLDKLKEKWAKHGK